MARQSPPLDIEYQTCWTGSHNSADNLRNGLILFVERQKDSDPRKSNDTHNLKSSRTQL
ncbi:MAG: hypothetical protein IT425_07450 [Pirellulales bacterium]|nr:hypothetical protein [Pirellulales bacterium]